MIQKTNRVRKGIIYSCFLFFSWFSNEAAASDTLVHRGAMWKYLDDGSDQGSAWTLPAFVDSSWLSGNAEFGYGDGDEVTVVNYGPSPSSKYITTYFRQNFYVANASGYRGLRMNIKRDDGAVVYLNGTEVYRSNLPADSINYLSVSPFAIAGPGDEAMYVPASIDLSALITGNNIIAVEIHQDDPASADLSFDMELIGDSDVVLMRGPYLQMSSPDSIMICYRTSGPEITKIIYGLSPSAMTDSVYDNTLSKDHAIIIKGLLPDTKYYYGICSATKTILADSSLYFKSAPDVMSRAPVRIWTMGDFGTGDVFQNLVRDAYYSYTGNQYTNLVLFLGDNAYPLARDEDYTINVFDGHYESILKTSAVYSACGNHEWFSANSINQTGPYYDIFHFPVNGENGGVPSGTEAYYSFNYSNIHFICLESNIDSFGAASVSSMTSWLYADLNQNSQPWIIAYFHEPPYSKGYHDSDTDSEMVYIRENILPILESYNVDLVLSGHSHSYERTYLLKGHYGISSTLDSTMIVDGGSGALPDYYSKISPSDSGTVYAVVASAGEIVAGQPDWPHPAMYFATDSLYGSMVIDVNGDSLNAKFITSDTVVADQFTIIKSISTDVKNILPADNMLNIYPTVAMTILNISFVQSTQKVVAFSIYDSMGRRVKTWKSMSSEKFLNQVNISDLQEGIYYLTTDSANDFKVKRFIKVK